MKKLNYIPAHHIKDFIQDTTKNQILSDFIILNRDDVNTIGDLFRFKPEKLGPILTHELRDIYNRLRVLK
jgi:hypothetical protein